MKILITITAVLLLTGCSFNNEKLDAIIAQSESELSALSECVAAKTVARLEETLILPNEAQTKANIKADTLACMSKNSHAV